MWSELTRDTNSSHQSSVVISHQYTLVKSTSNPESSPTWTNCNHNYWFHHINFPVYHLKAKCTPWLKLATQPSTDLLPKNTCSKTITFNHVAIDKNSKIFFQNPVLQLSFQFLIFTFYCCLCPHTSRQAAVNYGFLQELKMGPL